MLIHVGLDPWILSDGNYEDFSVGQERKFALEFYGPDLAPAREGGLMLEHRGSCNYAARGEVVYSTADIWVCDFGVLAYSDQSVPRWSRVGTGVAGEIYLGIDHYAYFEHHHELPGMPKLTYVVGIRRIYLERTPMIPDPEGKYSAIPDTSRTEVREVDSTDLSLVDLGPTPPDLPSQPGAIVPSIEHHFVLECEILESGVSPLWLTG